jgi:error-prone DNA polymerase
MGPGTRSRLTALLNVHSFFSQGVGVSSPRRLVETAALTATIGSPVGRLPTVAAQGYSYLCLTDHLSIGGAVELYQAAKQHKLTPLIGATVPLEHASGSFPLVLIAASREGYESLNVLITLGLEGEGKAVTLPILEAHAFDLFCLTGGREGFPTVLLGRRRVRETTTLLEKLKPIFRDRLFVQLYHDRQLADTRRARALRRLARDLRLPCVAAPDIRYATADLYPLYDALACARLGIMVRDPHPQRPRNDCQYLLSPEEAGERLRPSQR